MVLVILGVIVGVLALFVIGFFVYCTIKSYKPEPKEVVAETTGGDPVNVEDTLRVLSWNVGYAGLNKEMDFFYENGHQVRPTEKVVNDNLLGISDFLQKSDDVDFFILQEVDSVAKRSYYINELDYLSKKLPAYHRFFSINYNVGYVPLPLTEPMGKVVAGLATFTKKEPKLSVRYAYPFHVGWPTRLFLLNRCFMTTRYETTNGKELIVINTHNSAFDNGGTLRIAELNFLKDFMKKEYEKGNYVVVGGDFNQSPVSLKPEFEGEVFDFDEFISVPDSLFTSDWTCAFDNSVPTNRRVDIPYTKGVTRTTLVDFFIASPNVEVLSVKNISLGFVHTDHNPVRMEFKLK